MCNFAHSVIPVYSPVYNTNNNWCMFFFNVKLDTLYITYNLDTFGCVDSDAFFTLFDQL